MMSVCGSASVGVPGSRLPSNRRGRYSGGSERPQGSEVRLDTSIDHRLDREEVADLVRCTVRARGELLLGRMLKESSLTYDLLELSLQHTALTTRGNPTHTHTHTP